VTVARVAAKDGRLLATRRKGAIILRVAQDLNLQNFLDKREGNFF